MKQDEQFVDEFDWLSYIIAGSILIVLFYFSMLMVFMVMGVA